MATVIPEAPGVASGVACRAAASCQVCPTTRVLPKRLEAVERSRERRCMMDLPQSCAAATMEVARAHHIAFSDTARAALGFGSGPLFAWDVSASMRLPLTGSP